MELETFISAAIYGAALIGSPGPAVISLFQSGINYGFKKTMPYFTGILLGYLLNQLASAVALFSAVKISPVFYEIAKVIALMYIGYLSYKIITSNILKNTQLSNPLKFHHGVLLNCFNPKAYFISFTAFTQFANPQQLVYSVAVIIIMYLILDFVLQGAWILFGKKISFFLQNPKSRLITNYFLVAMIWVAILLAYLSK